MGCFGLRVGGLVWHMGWELLVCGCNLLLFSDSKLHWKKTIIFVCVVHVCLMLSYNRSSSLFRPGLLSVHVHLDKQHRSLKVGHGSWYPLEQHLFSKIEPVFPNYIFIMFHTLFVFRSESSLFVSLLVSCFCLGICQNFICYNIPSCLSLFYLNTGATEKYFPSFYLGDQRRFGEDITQCLISG